MPNEDVQKEWRELILKKLDHLDLSQEDMKKDISDIKLSITSPELIGKMQERVRELELFKERTATLFWVIQFLIGIGFTLLNRFLWK
jgi:hypothetical protein